jgi:hypothetical protein
MRDKRHRYTHTACMADDVSADDPIEDEAATAETERRRQLVIGIGAVVLLVLAGVIWLLDSDSETTRACTTAGAVGAPIAESSDAAFEAWFAESGVDASMGWVDRSGVPPPSIDDYEQVSDDAWEWQYQDNASVLVQTTQRDDAADGTEQWSVSGVNGCSYS